MRINLSKAVHYVLGLALLAGVLISTTHSISAADNSRFFTQTGKTVEDPFLAYWDANGGLAQQGYPITDAYDEENADDGNTYLTQYFERARFEYHPENDDPQYQVLLGLLGVEALKAKYGDTPPNRPTQIVPGGGSLLFPETGKKVTGQFLTYWNTHGGLAQQGFPITEAFNELNDADGKTYITQYFERARFEYHPEQNDPQYRVLLGLVGNEILSRKQANSAPTPTKAAGGPTATRTRTPAPGAPTATSTPVPPTATATPSGEWAGLWWDTNIDAGVVWPSGSAYANKAFFFKDLEYIRFDIPTRSTDASYPYPINRGWTNLPFTSVDAVAVWPSTSPYSGKAFFFEGDKYARYDILSDQTDPGYPLPISPTWPGLPFSSNLDAVAVWPTGKAYFFKGDQFARYDTTTDKTDPGYPQPIAGNWPGLGWTGNFDDVVVWPNGKVYFFKGSEYVAFDIANNLADPGYPKPIKGSNLFSLDK